MEDRDKHLLEFCYDVFTECKNKDVMVAEINDEDGKKFSLNVLGDADVLDEAKEVVLDLVPEASNFANGYSVTGYWVLSFDVPDDMLDNYERKNVQPELPDIKEYKEVKIDSDEEDEEIEEEDDDRKDVEIVKKDGRATIYADGVVEIELEPWEFEVMDPEKARYMKPMRFITILQYSMAKMIGQFLAMDDFKDKEVEHPYRVSGRWMFKGTSPTGDEYYFDIHDTDGSDTPNVYANGGYGVSELYEWIREKVKDVEPVSYERSIKLSTGKIGKFGVNADGEVWHDWNKCPR